MWLFRGAQSVVYYYAACTPCANSIQRRQRKKQAAKTHRDPLPPQTGENIVTDQPHVFQQPFPFTTNTYWDEEIALGPGPPAKRAKKKGKRRKGSKSKFLSVPDPEEEVTPHNAPGVLAGAVTGVLEDLVPSRKDKESSLKNQIEDRWNRIRYQREDEELWGGGAEIKGSSVGLVGRGRASTAGSAKYYIARNPEVNDLHPPVSCGPMNKAETRWMLQPPPSAKVMAGKVRCNASGHNSRHTSLEHIPDRYVNGERVGVNGQAEVGDEVDKDGQRRVSGSSQPAQKLQTQRDGRLNGLESSTATHVPPKGSLNRRKRDKPPPIVVAEDNFFALSPPAPDEVVMLSPCPVFAPLTTSTLSPNNRLQSSRDDFHLSPTPSLNSCSNSPSPTSPRHNFHNFRHHTYTNGSSDKSAPAPWQWPWQSTEEQFQSRPTSKATADSGKAFPAHLQLQQKRQKLHTAWPPPNIKIKDANEHVRSVHVEVSSPHDYYYSDDDEDEDVDVPPHSAGGRWRWSMDI
ncbi:hypothetical protein AJ79_01335 [Helicocarpus griseus UAMH5409]|uniref:Uncharacterized protein n=1 Tax=Helicocarpus griseus UAMH5409 TaxID=1447875 RepID=A0A2B7Y9A6_9EURO|nr:hypothetical protein AJ79_01335 [Helicocarpus griseus UAMH5409]